MHYPDSIVETRADGIGDVVLTASGAKLSLYQIRPGRPGDSTADPSSRVEVRQVVGIVSMSLPQLVEGLMNVLGAVAINAPALERARIEEFARMATSLSTMTVEQVQPSGPQVA
jgi:hypothetical protein